jgi:PleD family two-component response regulator
LIEAISKLAWPVLAVVAFGVLYPAIKRVMETRGVTIKIGGMELTVQDATEQLRKQIDDLQSKLSELRRKEGVSVLPAPTKDKRDIKSVLWVNDKPTEGALDIAALQSQGIAVRQATSTTEAMRLLKSGRFKADAVVTDMGRREEGEYRSNAGILLIELIRDARFDMPVVVYGASKYQEKNHAQAVDAGGPDTRAVSSSLELFEFLGLTQKRS